MSHANWTTGLPALAKRSFRSLRTRLGGHRRVSQAESQRSELTRYVVAHPTDPDGHYHLAEFYFQHGRYLAAAAECRTSLAFGGKSATGLLSRAYAAGDYDGEGIYGLPYVVYHRVNTLAAKISERFADRRPSVLDVGGGEGYLCLFLRDWKYALAEPTINGLSISHFPDKSFGVATACHVFEHIPEGHKREFLERLCAVARHAVILLGPLNTDKPQPDATSLIYTITGARWAREHMESGIPPLDLITNFAAERNKPCRIFPSGNLMAVYWAIFADYFATCAGRKQELHEIERFANKHLPADTMDPANPNEYLVEIDLE